MISFRQAAIILIISLAGMPNANAEPRASFDCAKAASVQEKLICSDEKLAAADVAVAAAFKAVRDRFDPKRRASLIAGQQTWLRLRDEVCLEGTDGDCLAGVYAGRLRELAWQNAKLDEEKARNRAPRIDLEALLDASREMWSELRLLVDEKEIKRRRPATCREFFTLRDGTWFSDSDVRSEASEQSARIQCLYAVLDQQKWPIRFSADDKSKFLNLKLYSSELSELASLVDPDTKRTVFRSIADEEAAGGFKIISKKKDERTDDDECVKHDVLVMSEKGVSEFCLNSWLAGLKGLSFGDFTHTGRPEMLARLDALPMSGMGGTRIHDLLIFYYDAKTKSIRPTPFPAEITPWSR